MADNTAQNGTSTIATDDVGGIHYQRIKLDAGSDGVASPVVDGGSVLIPVGGRTARVSASVTRPADTTAYAAGDVVTDNTTAGSATNLTFTSAARATGGSGVIRSALLIDSANQSTKGQFEVWIYQTAPATQGDNAAFAPSDAETETLIGIIPFNASYVGLATSGAGGNAVYLAQGINMEFVTSGSANLFGHLVSRNAYTPVSAEKFTVVLGIAQD